MFPASIYTTTLTVRIHSSAGRIRSAREGRRIRSSKVSHPHIDLLSAHRPTFDALPTLRQKMHKLVDANVPEGSCRIYYMCACALQHVSAGWGHQCDPVPAETKSCRLPICDIFELHNEHSRHMVRH